MRLDKMVGVRRLFGLKTRIEEQKSSPEHYPASTVEAASDHEVLKEIAFPEHPAFDNQDTDKAVPLGDPKGSDKLARRERYDAKTIHDVLIGKITDSKDMYGITIGSAIRFDNIKISGDLDLSALTIKKAVMFWRCEFRNSVTARYAHFNLLKLYKCYAPSLNLFQSKADNSILITKCYIANGIDLAQMEINGLLSLDSTIISKPLADARQTGNKVSKPKVALNCYRIKVLRGLSIRNMEVNGTIALRNAEIYDLNAMDAKLFCEAGNDASIDARGLMVHRNVLLGSGYNAHASTRLIGATINGLLDFRGGKFHGKKEIAAISCDGITAGNIFFHKDQSTNNDAGKLQKNEEGEDVKNTREAAKVYGHIILSNAKITGRLDMRGVAIKVSKGCESPALDCNYTQVEGNVLLSEGFIANGRINFHQATIHGQFNMDNADVSFTAIEDNSSKEKEERKDFNCNHDNSDEKETLDYVAVNINSATIAKNVYFRTGFKCNGVINGVGATLGGVLVFSECKINAKKEKCALLFRKARIKRSVEIEDGAEIVGGVTFAGAHIGFSFKFKRSSISCCEEWINNRIDEVVSVDSKIVIDLKAATVITSIEFKSGADIMGVIDLRRAKTRIYVDDGSSWENKKSKDGSRYLLEGFTYDYFPLDTKENKSKSAKGLYTKWIERKDSIGSVNEFSAQPWTQLATVLKNSGHEASARLVLAEREIARGKTTSLVDRLFHGIMGFIVGHGYKPMRGFWLGIVFITVGSVVFLMAEKDGMISPSPAFIAVKIDAEEINQAPEPYGNFSPILYSIDVFVPFLNLHQETRWHLKEKLSASTENSTQSLIEESPEIANEKVTQIYQPEQQLFDIFLSLTKIGLYKLYFSLHIIAGWIIVALVGLSLSGILKRG